MKISGIYKIQSISYPERCYIGSSIDTNKRWSVHIYDLRLNNHDNGKLQNHYNKYGEGDLIFSVLCPCEKDQLIQIEQYFLDFYHPWFNIRIKAESNLGIRYSKEVCKKMSERLKGKPMCEKTRLAIMKANIGRVCSKETKNKLSKLHIGMKASNEARINMSKAHMGLPSGRRGKKASLETIEKLRKTHKGSRPWSKKPILQFDKGMHFIKDWDSAVDAAKNLFVNRSGICNCIRGKSPTAYGFIWKFKFEIKKIA